MVIDPMVRALDAVSQTTNFADLYFELSLCFQAASVLKNVCLTRRHEDHAMLVQLEVVPKLMKVLGVIRDFLPQFKNVKNFNFVAPNFVVNSMTGQYINSVYNLLPYVANCRLFRELCGSISNCCQCLSNLQDDRSESTNCLPTIQLLAYDDGDGLRDLFVMLQDVVVTESARACSYILS